MMDDPDAVLEKAAQAVRQAIRTSHWPTANDLSVLQQVIRQTAARVIKAETVRRPVILPVVLETLGLQNSAELACEVVSPAT